MQTVAQQEDLKYLEQLLQDQLRSQFPQGDFIKIGCAIDDDGTLVILSQHPATEALAPELIFTTIQQTLESLRPQVVQPVKVLLRAAGQKQAYAKQSFILQPANSLPLTVERAREEHDVVERSPQYQKTTVERAREEDDVVERSPQRQIFVPVLVLGCGVAVAALLIGGYLLSHPCGIGRCKPLQTSQQMYQEASQTLQQANSQSDIALAQEQLTAAQGALTAIPRWSPYYGKAQQLGQTLSNQSATLNQMGTAFRKATAAAQKRQNPQNTAQAWQVTQTLWQEAIAPLETIPSSSPLYPLAQQKLSEYRANLQAVNQQWNFEQQSIAKLAQAKNTAQVATKHENAAQSLQDWQQIESTWQTAIKPLNTIPQTSTIYQEAQQLLKTYRSQLAAASNRSDREQIAAKAYKQATNFANVANSYEQQNQWIKASNTWQEALKSAKQVPLGTFYYRQTQPLIFSYSSKSEQAQLKQKVASVLQKAEADINRTCSGEIRVCNYSLNTQAMTVQLTPQYERALERGYTTANFRGDAQTVAGIVVHYQTLREALEAISDNAGISLQVYASNNEQLHTYKPADGK